MNTNPDITLHSYAIFKAFIKLSSGQIGQKSKMFQTPNHECLMGVHKASV